jgi:hypothetical protein
MLTFTRPSLGIVGFMVAIPLMASSCSNGGGTPAGGGGGTAATNGAAASKAASGPVAIGTVMTAKNGEAMTVATFGPAPPSGNEFQSPPAGKECVQVTLTINNGSNAEWTVPTAEVGAVDANGQKYDTAAMDCGNGDNISSLVAGGHATAKEIFEVPTGTALNLSWVPNQFENEVYQTKLR